MKVALTSVKSGLARKCKCRSSTAGSAPSSTLFAVHSGPIRSQQAQTNPETRVIRRLQSSQGFSTSFDWIVRLIPFVSFTNLTIHYRVSQPLRSALYVVRAKETSSHWRRLASEGRLKKLCSKCKLKLRLVETPDTASSDFSMLKHTDLHELSRATSRR